MADKVAITSAWSADFTQELLPSAERVALLYHLSYLCLGGFPKLERLLRERAVETQMLFGSSEALLLKCMGTSDNLVTSLLPSLKVAVEKNKPILAQKILDRAKAWIDEIIQEVKDIVNRYEKHNSDVAKSTSDIITEKEETEKNQKLLTGEMAAIQQVVDGLEANLTKINKDIADNEEKIEQKNADIQNYIKTISVTKDDTKGQEANPWADLGGMCHPEVAVVALIVPFIESIIRFISKMVTATSHKNNLKTFQIGLSELMDTQRRLKEQEWDIQNKLMDNQLKLAKLKIENGQTPSVAYLDEVQKCLSRIQQILIELQKFWQKIRALLDTLRGKTFAAEDSIGYLEDMKDIFLKSITTAEEDWTRFGQCCKRAEAIFSQQGANAYKFLEISPTSLSKEAWQIEYTIVKEKLENIKPNSPSQPALQ
ncbi:hypothetical protein DNTS_034155 [Danionella cerebrum]|uniref:Uncharacterized protein n=1 Tax=Danionella cerebrum TaxID=2873325 RepID=A0A553N097_9TELE|nr:hypothetical protein DNTS_034155 [Danionella translucida]TRY58864.1 hypothetical protein DNTS_034155 [Danionella translucida]